LIGEPLIGQRVLGAIGESLADAAPVWSRSGIPGRRGAVGPAAGLADVRGRPLARKELSLVFVPPGPNTQVKALIEGWLPLLPVYGLPVDQPTGRRIADTVL